MEAEEHKLQLATLKSKLHDAEQKVLVALEQEGVVAKLRAENDQIKEELSTTKNMNIALKLALDKIKIYKHITGDYRMCCEIA